MSVFAGLPKMPVRAALELAKRGVPVFPCNEKKRPMTASGFKDATCDAEQIKRWWQKSPNALIGVPTGERSGLDALDLDRKHGDPEEMLDELQQAVDAMFRGPRVRTMSGGLHQWFKHDPRIRIGASRFREGVDWRGEGGYAIAPDGLRYHLIADGDVEPWPEALVQLIVAHQGRPLASPQLSVVGGTDVSGLNIPYQRTTAELVSGTLTNGQWHDAMIRMVAIFVSRGFSLDEITALAPMFQRDGYSLDETIREVRKAAEGAYEKWGHPINGGPKVGKPEDLQLVPLAGLESRDPPEWQIAGVIPEKSFGYVYGPSATFKTFVAIDMALSIAYGRAWQGRPVKPGKVLYILGEGQGAFANRVRSWRHERGLTEADAGFWTLFQPIQFMSPQDVGRLVQAIKNTGVEPDWIFLDTVQRNFGVGDPDKTQDMTMFVAAIDAVRAELGCGVFAVHHAGKDVSKGARNSSVLYASADFEMKTEREQGSPAVILTNTKAKDWEEFPRLRLQADQVTVTDPRTGEQVTSLVIREGGDAIGDAPVKGKPHGKIEVAVYAALTQCGTLTVGEISARTGENKGSVSRALASLRAKLCVAKDEETGLHFIPEENQ